jgi:RNA 2',3'-cyclic 3'-phosphodiesterase
MARTATARLFVAIDPPLPVRERLTAWAREALRELGMRASDRQSVRVLDVELLHMTLCFMGERPLDETEPIGEALASCEAQVGELAVGGPLWLPPRSPRALAVEINDDADGGLQALHRELSRALSDRCGFRERHQRSFRAHVTLARLRGTHARGVARGGSRGRPGGAAGNAPASERMLTPTPTLAFRPQAMVLYRSRLSPEGASYEALVEQPL